jgi:hypothetical protein
MHFHTPASLFMILELGIEPWDNLCFEMFTWLKNNIIEEGQYFGWKGTPTSNPDKILLWATAYGLVSLVRFREALQNLERSRLLDKIFTPTTIETINAEAYSCRIKKCEEEATKNAKKKDKLIVALTSFGIVSFTALLVTNFRLLSATWLGVAANWKQMEPLLAPLFGVFTIVSIIVGAYHYVRKKKRPRAQQEN